MFDLSHVFARPLALELATLNLCDGVKAYMSRHISAALSLKNRFKYPWFGSEYVVTSSAAGDESIDVRGLRASEICSRAGWRS